MTRNFLVYRTRNRCSRTRTTRISGTDTGMHVQNPIITAAIPVPRLGKHPVFSISGKYPFFTRRELNIQRPIGPLDVKWPRQKTVEKAENAQRNYPTYLRGRERGSAGTDTGKWGRPRAIARGYSFSKLALAVVFSR